MFRIFLSEIYELIDAKYYASNSRINTEGTPYNNDRIIFASDYSVEVGDIIHFRFHSIPNKIIFGVGSTAGSDLTIEKNGTTYNLWRNVVSNERNINSSGKYTLTTNYDFIFKKTTYSGYSNKIAELTNNNENITWWQMGNTIKKIRVDKFNNDDYNIEVFVL